MTAELDALAGASEMPPSPSHGAGKGHDTGKINDSVMSFASTSSAGGGGSLKPSDIERATYKLSLKATSAQQWHKGAAEARGAVCAGPVRLVVGTVNQMARAVKLTVKSGGMRSKTYSAMVNGGAAAVLKVWRRALAHSHHCWTALSARARACGLEQWPARLSATATHAHRVGRRFRCSSRAPG